MSDFFSGVDLTSGAHIFTDGSINNTTGGQVLYLCGGETHGSWTVQTPCSSTLTELVAVQQALRQAFDSSDDVTVNTDSQAAKFAVLQSEPTSHVNVILEIQSMEAVLTEEGRSLTISWIPGHAHITANVKADALARSATLTAVELLLVLLQHSVVMGMVRMALCELQRSDIRQEISTGSSTLNW